MWVNAVQVLCIQPYSKLAVIFLARRLAECRGLHTKHYHAHTVCRLAGRPREFFLSVSWKLTACLFSQLQHRDSMR